MPTATNIVIADSTPANRTYSPVGPTQAGDFLYEDRVTAATSAGFSSIYMGLSRANGNRATNRGRIRLNLPTEQTVDGIVSIAYVARADLSLVLPDQMTGTERAHFWALFKNLIAHAAAEDLGQDLDAPY